MNTNLRTALAIASLLLAVACGKSDNDTADVSGTTEPVAAAPATASGALPRTPSVDGAYVHFVTPRDGDTVSNPVILNFAVTGMGVAPAGDNTPKTGHHHVIIDADLPAMDMPIPADAKHIHFGDGSSTAELTLEPGEHTLQLVFADHLHIPHEPPVYSDRITITVE